MKFFRPSIFASLGLSVLLIAGAYAFTAPQTVFADPPSSYRSGLVPCGTSQNGANEGGATGCQACDLVSLLQKVINFMLGLSIPIAIALFAYAGILYFTSTTNQGNISKAKGMFSSALTGLIIALGAYLVVETVLHAVLKPEYFTGWNTVDCVASDQRRINANISDVFSQAINTFTNGTKAPVSITTGGASGGVNGSNVGVGETGVPYYGGPLSAGRLCAASNPACSVSVLQSDGLSYSQAQAMSCIAVTESGGNPSIGCSATKTPCGLYQINNGNWDMYAPAGCRPYAQKNNATCNRETAIIMLAHDGYQPWTGSSGGVHWNPNAVRCVQTYDPYTYLKT